MNTDNSNIEQRDTGTSRRSVLAGIAGVLGASNSFDGKTRQNLLPSASRKRQMARNITTHGENQRPAYVTLPSFCTKYLCANLHELMGRRPRPVILMDTHDYKRVWGQIVLERERPMQMVGMIIDTLRRRGLVKTIDYRKYYSATDQEQNLIQCQNAIEGLSDHKQQAVAEEAADGFIDHFQQLGHQKSFRKALDNWDHALKRKSQAESRVRRLRNGGGTPQNRAERLAMQYIAALEVRRTADKHLDLNVVGIIGQGEGKGVSTLLHDSSFTLDDDVARLSPGGRSIKQIRRFSPDETAFERDTLDSIIQVAQEAARTQHNDWFLLGSRVAVPHFPKLFVESWSQPNLKTDTAALAAETREILSQLERRAADNQPAHLSAEAEAIAEQQGITAPKKIEEIRRELNRAVDLANTTPALRDLAEGDRYESASIMAAASVLMDPKYRFNEDETFRLAWNIKQQHNSAGVLPRVIERYSNRGGLQEDQREKQPDWYQSFDPVRV